MNEELEKLIKGYEVLFEEACKYNMKIDQLEHIKGIRHVLNMMRAELEDRLDAE